MKTLSLAIIVFILSSSQVLACSCGDMTIEEQIEKADHIFISKIMSKEDKSGWFTDNGTLYKHKILKVLKGNLKDTTYSFTHEEMTSCDVKPEMNIERVVFVSGEAPYRLGGCQYGGEKSMFDKIYPNWQSSFNKKSVVDAKDAQHN